MENVSQFPTPEKPELSHDELLESVMVEFRSIGSKLDCISRRLNEGDKMFRGIEANMNVCLRGLQTLLLEKAAELQVNASLTEVTQVLNEIESRDTLVPSDAPTSPHNERPVQE